MNHEGHTMGMQTQECCLRRKAEAAAVAAVYWPRPSASPHRARGGDPHRVKEWVSGRLKDELELGELPTARSLKGRRGTEPGRPGQNDRSLVKGRDRHPEAFGREPAPCVGKDGRQPGPTESATDEIWPHATADIEKTVTLGRLPG